MKDRILGEALTFDDVLLVPRRSAVVPATVDVRSKASRRVGLNVPILSAAMDTVTESALAIALAQQGGLGVVHKNLSVDEQVREVHLVKRSVNGVIADPVTLPPDAPIAKARELMEVNRISGIPIVTAGKVVGILTSRDLRFVETGQSVVRADDDDRPRHGAARHRPQEGARHPPPGEGGEAAARAPRRQPRGPDHDQGHRHPRALPREQPRSPGPSARGRGRGRRRRRPRRGAGGRRTWTSSSWTRRTATATTC